MILGVFAFEMGLARLPTVGGGRPAAWGNRGQLASFLSSPASCLGALPRLLTTLALLPTRLPRVAHGPPLQGW